MLAPTVRPDCPSWLVRDVLVGDNEAALSVTPVAFHDRGGESFVVVGTSKGLTFHPRNHQGCFVHVYRFLYPTV